MGKVLNILSFREELLTAWSPAPPAPETARATSQADHPASKHESPVSEGAPAEAAEEIPFVEVPEAKDESPSPPLNIAAGPHQETETIAFQAAATAVGSCPDHLSPELLVARAPDSPVARQYQQAAEVLQGRLALEQRRTLLLVPVTANDCTTAAANLALALAADGRSRVLLIDADTRARKVGGLFAVSAAPGWGDLVAGIEPPLAIQEGGWQRLHLIVAGNRLVAAHAAFRAERIRRLLERLRADYDLILVKSAVWEEAHLPVTLAQACDAVCLLAGRDASSRTAEVRCTDWFRGQDVRLLGSILLPA